MLPVATVAVATCSPCRPAPLPLSQSIHILRTIRFVAGRRNMVAACPPYICVRTVAARREQWLILAARRRAVRVKQDLISCLTRRRGRCRTIAGRLAVDDTIDGHLQCITTQNIRLFVKSRHSPSVRREYEKNVCRESRKKESYVAVISMSFHSHQFCSGVHAVSERRADCSCAMCVFILNISECKY